MPLLRLEAARKGSVELHFDARADPLVAVARPATKTTWHSMASTCGCSPLPTFRRSWRPAG